MSQHWWQSSSRFYRLWSGIGFLTAVGDSLASILEGVGVLLTWRKNNEVASLKAALNAYYAENYPRPINGNEEDSHCTFIFDATPFSGELTLFQIQGKPTPEELKQRLKEQGQQVAQALQSEHPTSFLLSSPYRDFYISLMEQGNICHLDFQALSLSQNTRKKFHAVLHHLLWVNPKITYLTLNSTEQAIIEREALYIIEQLAYNQRRIAMQTLSEQPRKSFSFSEEAINTWKAQELQPFTDITVEIIIELALILGESADKKIVIPQLNERVKQAKTSLEEDKAYETLSFYHSLLYMRFQLAETLQQITDWLSPTQPKKTSLKETRTTDFSDGALVLAQKKQIKKRRSLSSRLRQFFSGSRKNFSSDGNRSSSPDNQKALIGKPKPPETTEEMEAYLRGLSVQLLIPRKKNAGANLAQCQTEVARIIAIDKQYHQEKINIEERNERILYDGLIKHGFNYDYSFAFESLEFGEVMQVKRYLEHHTLFSEITARISESEESSSLALSRMAPHEVQIIIERLGAEQEKILSQKIKDAEQNYQTLLLSPEEIETIHRVFLKQDDSAIRVIHTKIVKHYQILELDPAQVIHLQEGLASSSNPSIRTLGERLVFNVHNKLLTTKQSYCHPDTVKQHPELQADFQKATAILSGMSEWTAVNTENKRSALNRMAEIALHAEVYQGRLNVEASWAQGKKYVEAIRETDEKLSATWQRVDEGLRSLDKGIKTAHEKLDKLEEKRRRKKEKAISQNQNNTNASQGIYHDGIDSNDSRSSQSSQRSHDSSDTDKLSDEQRFNASTTILSRNPSLSAIHRTSLKSSDNANTTDESTDSTTQQKENSERSGLVV